MNDVQPKATVYPIEFRKKTFFMLRLAWFSPYREMEFRLASWNAVIWTCQLYGADYSVL